MKVQLESLGCSFDWSKEVFTCRPDYYKWTQALFVRMMKAGLAYAFQFRLVVASCTFTSRDIIGDANATAGTRRRRT